MASEIKVNKITGKGATGGADAPLQFDGNVLTTATIANATITNATITDATISKINLSATTPSSPVEGDMYYDTTNKDLKIYSNSFWVSIIDKPGHSQYTTDDYTKLLIHSGVAFTDMDGSTTFVDSSNSTHTITANGGVQHKIAQKKLGGTSVYFDGNGDYFTIPASADWNPYGVNFTVDFWIYFNSFQDHDSIVACNSADAYGWNIQANSSKKILFMAGDGGGWDFNTNSGAQSALATGQWYHVATVKEGTTWNQYVNGTLYSGPHTSASENTDSVALWIGNAELWNTRYLDAYIDEFRISKGIARWTSNFTVY